MTSRQLRCIILFLTCFILWLPLFPQTSENDIKAVFLGKFAMFTEWPDTLKMSDKTHPFVIGVYANSKWFSILSKSYTHQKIQGKPVRIKIISGFKEIEECHILFISGDQKHNLQSILLRTKNRPILTISETEGFAKKGILINMYLEKNKLRFEINESAVHQSGLLMSYQLIRLAKIINPLGDRG